MPGRATASQSSNQSRFTPAQRVGIARDERIYSIRGEDEDEAPESGGQALTSHDEAEPLTKSGYPDRRFKGHREDPTPDVANPEYRRARVGGVVGDMHVTVDGTKPDRRFKENRGLSEEDAMKTYAERLAEEFGIIKQ